MEPQDMVTMTEMCDGFGAVIPVSPTSNWKSGRDLLDSCRDLVVDQPRQMDSAAPTLLTLQVFVQLGFEGTDQLECFSLGVQTGA